MPGRSIPLSDPFPSASFRIRVIEQPSPFFTVGDTPPLARAGPGCKVGPMLKQKKAKIQFMKHQALLLTFLSIAAFAVGCHKEQTTSQQIDQLKSDTKAAAQDLKEQDYTFAQKAEYTDKMQTQLANINRDLD